MGYNLIRFSQDSVSENCRVNKFLDADCVFERERERDVKKCQKEFEMAYQLVVRHLQIDSSSPPLFFAVLCLYFC